MGSRKRIVAKEITQTCQKLRHPRIVSLFHRGKPGIFRQNNRVLRQSINRRPAWAFHEGYATAQSRLKRRLHQFQTHRRLNLAIGPSEMRQQHDFGPARHQLLHRGHSFLDPCGVCDMAVFHRHIDIHPAQHNFASQCHVVDCFERHHRLHCCFIFFPPKARVRQPLALSYWRHPR